jgi:hypothetical protein
VICGAFYKLFQIVLYHTFRIWESTVMIEIRSCCPECVVAVFYDLFVGNLSTVVLMIFRC